MREHDGAGNRARARARGDHRAARRERRASVPRGGLGEPRAQPEVRYIATSTQRARGRLGPVSALRDETSPSARSAGRARPCVRRGSVVAVPRSMIARAPSRLARHRISTFASPLSSPTHRSRTRWQTCARAAPRTRRPTELTELARLTTPRIGSVSDRVLAARSRASGPRPPRRRSRSARLQGGRVVAVATHAAAAGSGSERYGENSTSAALAGHRLEMPTLGRTRARARALVRGRVGRGQPRDLRARPRRPPARCCTR